MLFKTPWNADLFEDDPTNGEVNHEPSMTIPDQSMSIEEIVNRFASGEPISVGHDVYYETDEVHASFDDYDPTADGSFDLADASAMQADLAARREARRVGGSNDEGGSNDQATKPNAIPQDPTAEASSRPNDAP